MTTPALPAATDQEQIILGALLLNESLEQLDSIADDLQPSDFLLPSHRAVFVALLEMRKRHEPPRLNLLVEELKRTRQLKRIGGPAFLATLIDGIPRFSDLSAEIKLIKKAAKARELKKLAEQVISDDSGSSLSEQALRAVQRMSEIVADADERSEAGAGAPALARSWADFAAEAFTQGERIAFAVERGEIALLNALPNAGKTTLALNAALSLASGRELLPVVGQSQPRRVLYVDGETRRARLQRDLRWMSRDFSRDEAIALGQNLHVICEAEISGESLALTRADHLQTISQEALRVKPDLIVVDTLASLCPVFNENDNAEQQRRVWQPLQKLARQVNAAILVLHHVGKRNEDSQSPERVYRGRGASASGGAARAVWLLTPDPVTAGLSTLACVKAKGDTPPDTRFQLDDSRWMRSIAATAPKPTSALEHVLRAVTREMRAAEIVAALHTVISERTVKECLSEALRLGHLRLVRRGVYAPAGASAEASESESADRAESADPSFAQTARSAQPPEESENGVCADRAMPLGGCTIARTRNSLQDNDLAFVQFVQPPKGIAQTAQTRRNPLWGHLADDAEVI